mgnify:CR=1 FL=1
MILLATVDTFLDEISDAINEYTEGVKKRLEGKLDETAEHILAYLKSNAPRSGYKNAMADSFKQLTKGDGVNKVITIYAENKGRIIHLLEFGFTHRNGKYVSPRPFMRPAFDTFTPKMIEDIKEMIKRG